MGIQATKSCRAFQCASNPPVANQLAAADTPMTAKGAAGASSSSSSSSSRSSQPRSAPGAARSDACSHLAMGQDEPVLANEGSNRRSREGRRRTSSSSSDGSVHSSSSRNSSCSSRQAGASQADDDNDAVMQWLVNREKTAAARKARVRAAAERRVQAKGVHEGCEVSGERELCETFSTKKLKRYRVLLGQNPMQVHLADRARAAVCHFLATMQAWIKILDMCIEHLCTVTMVDDMTMRHHDHLLGTTASTFMNYRQTLVVRFPTGMWSTIVQHSLTVQLPDGTAKSIYAGVRLWTLWSCGGL